MRRDYRGKKDFTREEDEADLMLLHVLETEGISVAMRRFKMTRNQISGLRHRTLAAAREKIGTALDGTMGPLWWQT